MNTATAELLTVAEVADYLRVSRTTVWRWIKEDVLIHGVKVGRGWRIHKDELVKITEGNHASDAAGTLPATADVKIKKPSVKNPEPAGPSPGKTSKRSHT